MAQTRFSFPSGTSGDAATSGNTGSDSVVVTGGTAALSNAQAILGSLSLLMTASTTSGGLYIQKAVTVTAGFAVDAYVYLTAAPSAEVQTFIGFYNGTTRQVSLALNADRTIRIRDGAAANIWTSTAAIPLNQWTRVALYATQDAAAGTVRAAMFDGHSSTPISGGDSTLMTGRNTGSSAYASLRLGVKGSTGTQTGTAHIGSYASDPAAAGLTTPVSNAAPTVAPTSSPQGCVKVVANAADSDGTIATYVWDVTSTPASPGAYSIQGASASTAYLVYTTTGNYGVRCTVTDNNGASTAATITVNALGLAAVAQHTYICDADNGAWV